MFTDTITERRSYLMDTKYRLIRLNIVPHRSLSLGTMMHLSTKIGRRDKRCKRRPRFQSNNLQGNSDRMKRMKRPSHSNKFLRNMKYSR